MLISRPSTLDPLANYRSLPAETPRDHDRRGVFQRSLDINTLKTPTPNPVFAETPVNQIEEAFKAYTTRDDVAVVLITQVPPLFRPHSIPVISCSHARTLALAHKQHNADAPIHCSTSTPRSSQILNHPKYKSPNFKPRRVEPQDFL